ncbi:hypothetical protein H6F89_00125, partial [Cyanobacteria bacterium FACHB-63]|nr:hypothetical protein [Cyanobacteria bacterium FACHB-63]
MTRQDLCGLNRIALFQGISQTRLTRRRFTELSVLTGLGLILPSKVNALPHSAPFQSKPSLRLGTTFSQLQCSYLGLDYQETFRQLCDLGFDH